MPHRKKNRRPLLLLCMAAALVISLLFAIKYGVDSSKLRKESGELRLRVAELSSQLAEAAQRLQETEAQVQDDPENGGGQNDPDEAGSGGEEHTPEGGEDAPGVPVSNPTEGMEHPEYQELYPDFYAETDFSAGWNDQDNVAYLTFDDGPTERTPEVLDILAQKGVKATFFVVGTNLKSDFGQKMLQRIVDEGHTVAMHSMTHKYNVIYSSVEAFLDDFNQEYELIYEISGVHPTLFRFPGGSINTYNKSIYKELISEMLRRGFLYYDWNVSGEDAAGAKTAQAVASNVISQSEKRSRCVVLLHDGEDKTATVAALPGMIDSLTAQGKQILPLDESVKPIVYGYRD